MEREIRKYKWKIHSVAFFVLLALFVFCASFFEEKTWLSNILQTIGTVIGIYLTVIIFLYSKEDSDRQFKEHLDYLQELNRLQIEALKYSTELQIKVLQEANANHIDAVNTSTEKHISALHSTTKKQIEVLIENSKKQIEVIQTDTEKLIASQGEITLNHINALHSTTEKQIEAMQRTTFQQISSFEQQITPIVNNLSDNSVLLAEILGRELEKALESYQNAINREEAKYRDLSTWKFMRTAMEKEHQLNSQWRRIEAIKRGYDYLVNKYNQVREYLGYGQKRLGN